MKFRLMVAMAMMLSLAGLAATASPAAAATNCNVVITDDAHMLIDHAADINQAACRLAGLGAHVQLITLTDTGDIRLGDYLVANATELGIDLQDPLRLVFMMTRDQQSGIYKGTHWQPVLDGIGGNQPGWASFLKHANGLDASSLIAGITGTFNVIEHHNANATSAGQGTGIALVASRGPFDPSSRLSWFVVVFLISGTIALVRAVGALRRPTPIPVAT